MSRGVLSFERPRPASLNIPQDLSIVGFDDIYGADLTNPPLTTIKVPLFTMGLLAANRMNTAVDGTVRRLESQGI